jgi:hypothetical protein
MDLLTWLDGSSRFQIWAVQIDDWSASWTLEDLPWSGRIKTKEWGLLLVPLAFLGFNLYVRFFMSCWHAVYLFHIVSILGPLRTLKLQCLGPDRIIYRTYSAKENSFNEFMKCPRYILIVKMPEFSLEILHGMAIRREGQLGYFCGGHTPLPIIFRAVRIPREWFHKGLRYYLSLYL